MGQEVLVSLVKDKMDAKKKKKGRMDNFNLFAERKLPDYINK